MKIMIVDDEAKIRNGMLKLLSSQKMWDTPEAFADAESAFDYLRSHKADVLITDIKMPEVSGLELIKQIREIDKRVQIIILSGYSNFSYAQKAIEMGVYRYLTKPTNPREVLSVLTKINEDLQLQEQAPADAEKAEGENAEVFNLAIAKALRYIESNYSSKITLNEMADKLFLSPNYLCKLFKKHTGKNLMEYLTDYRMEKAKEYLKDVQYKVSDVSELVGFVDTKYFSSTFKKVCGVTPMEYRNGRNAENE